MPEFSMPDLISELERDESVRRFPYKDTKGKTTIGCGRNLSDNGLSESEIEFLLDNDIKAATTALDLRYPWWRTLTDARQRVLINMMFNMGPTKLAEFVNTLAAVRDGRYDDAASGMLASEWSKEVGARATRLAEMMKTG